MTERDGELQNVQSALKAMLLISVGMTVNFVDSNGTTALDYVALGDQVEMVRRLASEPTPTHSVFRRLRR